MSCRGFIHQCTDMAELDAKMAQGLVVAYVGFDATAVCLHVGSLMPIFWLRKLQEHGHKPLVLLGGATTRIGDPTGKDKARTVLPTQDIKHNIQALTHLLQRFIVFGRGSTEAVIYNNEQWIDLLSYSDFLKLYGQHFTLNRMLTFESVRQRLDRQHSMSLLEFHYMVIQAIDFLHLFKEHACVLQLGGSDQWGNIVNGVELVRRVTGVLFK